MNTRWIFTIAIAVAVSGLMWQMAGFGALFAGTAPGDQLESSSENLSQAANESAVDDDFTGDASPSDGNLVGLALSGIGAFVNAISFAVQLPGQLLELGLPNWAAEPIRNMVMILLGIGVIQFAANRIWR